MSRGIVDSHGRPLPRFYELDIPTRGFVIQHERAHAYVRRSYLSPVERFKDVARTLSAGDSMHALDLYDGREQKELYQRILMGV
jgi:hypothetical protein